MDSKDEWGQAIARDISHSIARKIAIGIALGIAFLIFIIVGGIAVQLLWNWLLPDIFGVRPITVWEGLGLLALCRILFGGFSRGGSSRDHSGRRRGRDHKAWWNPPAPATSGPAASAAPPPAG